VNNGSATRVDVELASVDLDDDGDMDLADFGEFASWWLHDDCDLCGGADFSADGSVGPQDLSGLAENWLSGAQ